MVGKAIVRSELISSLMVRLYIIGISVASTASRRETGEVGQKERKYV
jgi:hypothetical protein